MRATVLHHYRRKGCLDEMVRVDAWVLTEENRNRELELDTAEL